MKKWLLTGVIALSAQIAYAEGIQDNDVYLYPHYTNYKYDTFKGVSIDTDDGFGIALGTNLDKNWGLELSWDEIKTTAGLNTDVRTRIFQLNNTYTFNTDGTLQPFLLAGLGYVDGKFDVHPTFTPNGTSVNFGFGAKIILSSMLELRADIRDVHTMDHQTDDFMTTVGFNIRFGKSTPPLDSDGDGVYDDGDRCPATPTGAAVDSSGCELDSDADGVANSQDKCPTTPTGVAVDARGCALDTDGDGVVDHLDKCPDTPEGALVDENGCRKMLTEAVSIKLALTFDTNKADIKPEFIDQIAKVAKFMTEYPDTTVVIEGHTDSTGAAKYNKSLSQKRAQAVADSLVNEHHVAANRVSAVGYGEEKPIADNNTADGRKANRRVVAQISTTVTKPEEK